MQRIREKISVIVPCYNVGHYIDRCLKSIEDQTYGMADLEVILVDDGSTDDTHGHLSTFEKKYPEQVILVACDESNGPGTARNIGLRYATGMYITFVDADDIVDPSMVEKMYRAIKEHKCEVVGCMHQSFENMEDIISERIEEDKTLRFETLEDREWMILNFFKTAVWGRLYKRMFLEENRIAFPEKIMYGEDIYFSGLVMLLCGSYHHIGEILYHYFRNVDGITNQNNNDGGIIKLDDVRKAFMDRVSGIQIPDGCRDAFEWFMIAKFFIDPVNFIILRKRPEQRALILYLREEILKLFPEAYDDHYLMEDERGRIYAPLLRKRAETVDHAWD